MNGSRFPFATAPQDRDLVRVQHDLIAAPPAGAPTADRRRVALPWAPRRVRRAA